MRTVQNSIGWGIYNTKTKLWDGGNGECTLLKPLELVHKKEFALEEIMAQGERDLIAIEVFETYTIP